MYNNSLLFFTRITFALNESTPQCKNIINLLVYLQFESTWFIMIRMEKIQ